MEFSTDEAAMAQRITKGFGANNDSRQRELAKRVDGATQQDADEDATKGQPEGKASRFKILRQQPA